MTPGDTSPVKTSSATTQVAAGGPPELDDMVATKLWGNPCGMAFRLNYLALKYNTPCYHLVQRRHGLSRIEYVVIYSLALSPGAQARDIASSSGFPKNSMSRAVSRLDECGYIKRKKNRDDKREQALYLTAKGQRLFDITLNEFEQREQTMLEVLSSAEQEQLSQLMARLVVHCQSLPDELPDTVD